MERNGCSIWRLWAIGLALCIGLAVALPLSPHGLNLGLAVLVATLAFIALLGIRFGRIPQEGDVYECTAAVLIHYHTSYNAPCSGGGTTIFPKGERLYVRAVARWPRRSYNCDPLRYKELEHQLLPQEEFNEYYSGYCCNVDLRTFERSFRLVSSSEPDSAGRIARAR